MIRYKKTDLDETLWGPAPTRLQYYRALTWHWRWHTYFKVVRRTVCRHDGHRPVFVEPCEYAWGGFFKCTRCRADICHLNWRNND